MTTTLRHWLIEQDDKGRLFSQESLIVATAETIWEEMERRNVTKAGLAEMLGKSKAFVTQILSGDRNMTLRTLADIAFALEVQVELRLRPALRSADWQYSEISRSSTRTESIQLDLPEAHCAANDWHSGVVTTPTEFAEAV